VAASWPPFRAALHRPRPGKRSAPRVTSVCANTGSTIGCPLRKGARPQSAQGLVHSRVDAVHPFARSLCGRVVRASRPDSVATETSVHCSLSTRSAEPPASAA
jgi:hypothetical protein